MALGVGLLGVARGAGQGRRSCLGGRGVGGTYGWWAGLDGAESEDGVVLWGGFGSREGGLPWIICIIWVEPCKGRGLKL